MPDLNYVLSCFDGVKHVKGDSYKAICPCHNDDNASLSITLKNDKILMKCMAGCPTADILGIAGLSFADLGSGSEKKDFSLFERMAFGMRDRYGDNIFVKDHYDYVTESGKYLYTKVRFEGGDFGGDKKLIRYYCIDYAAGTWTHGKPENCPKVLYRLPKLLKAIRDGYPVCIVEGEKDVHTLEAFGWTAVTPGGAQDWLPAFARYFKGADVRIFPDNDKAGETLAEQIAKDLYHYAYKIRIVKTSQAPKGDVTDYLHEGGHSKETLMALISEAQERYAPWIEKGKNSETINTDKLAHAFDKQEDYLICRSDSGAKTYDYIYEDGLYVPCDMNRFKGELSKYYGYGKVTANSIKNAAEILHFRGSHFRHMDDLNADEDIINLNNGILHLSDMRFEPHSPKYLTTYRVDVDYDPSATVMPNFQKFITELCINDENAVDESKLAVLQEIMGLILSNVRGYRPKKAFILHALIGNSGKSQYVNLLVEMLGKSRCAQIPFQQLNEQNRFALSKLPSARLVHSGDLSTRDVEDSSVFKRMTGGDTVTVEQKGIDPVTFHFKGVILYACNVLPNIRDDKGDQIFERMMLIPMQHTVPEAERDPMMLDKMLTEKSAIFNWAVQGVKRLIENNYHFTECEAINLTSQLYRERIDTVSRFLEAQGYTVTNDRKDKVNAKDLFEKYKAYCENKENEISKYITTSASFADRLAGRGVIKKKYCGTFVFQGVKEGFINVDDDVTLPFPNEK